MEPVIDLASKKREKMEEVKRSGVSKGKIKIFIYAMSSLFLPFKR